MLLLDRNRGKTGLLKRDILNKQANGPLQLSSTLKQGEFILIKKLNRLPEIWRFS